ncbi:MAG TPA: hypothetical protein PK054_05580 [Anaerohalosphaeraceae bacterium]|nr:hypothetical protein [Anaerohalosphaeraceae bacterium]HOL88178.1 hypothetical protein [Anaerohalosphaeraceae bacterium]HPP56037.1 hypothetical protein [Anaerohalosphaeraceae bacterium]
MKAFAANTKSFFLLLVLFGTIGLISFAAVSEKSREYEISVPPYKSDMVRMIEAYERLSDQYLVLVQQHLLKMDADNQAVLKKLEALEKKLDELNRKIDRLLPSESPAAERTSP